MIRKPKAGLLPFYLELYDRTAPELRRQFSPFLSSIVKAFDVLGIDIVQSEPCCIRPEFSNAVTCFQHEDVDLVITIHLALFSVTRIDRGGSRMPRYLF